MSATLSDIISKYLDIQEGKRKKFWKGFRWSLLYGLIFVYAVSFAADYFLDMDLFFVLFIVAVGYIIYKGIRNYKTYKKDYTTSFITPLMKHLYPDLVYKPKEMVSREVFDKSGLFPSELNAFKGEDLFEGKVNGYRIAFSEVMTGNKNQNRSNSANENNYFLHGLFFSISGTFPVYHPYYVRNVDTRISLKEHLKDISPMANKERVHNGANAAEFEVYKEHGDPDPEIPFQVLKVIKSASEKVKKNLNMAEVIFSARSGQISVTLQPMKIFEPPVFKKSEVMKEKLERNLRMIEELISLSTIYTN